MSLVAWHVIHKSYKKKKAKNNNNNNDINKTNLRITLRERIMILVKQKFRPQSEKKRGSNKPGGTHVHTYSRNVTGVPSIKPDS